MSAVGRVRDRLRGGGPMRLLGASGQLGYGIPGPALEAGMARDPHLVGCDMGSIDIGPSYLGRGEVATAPGTTKRDLRKVLRAARQHDVPLVIGSAGSAGAGPHLQATLATVREIAREDGLRFRLGVLHADIPKETVKAAVRAGETQGVDGMPALTEADVDACANLVAQMGSSSFARALAEDIDVLVAGRACDTAIFSSLPILLGFPAGPATHAAKIIECASQCCVPGGRDTIMATLDHEGFELESMAPQRRATPVSVAAHSLYEQSDPYSVQEPDGRLDLAGAHYAALDDRRTRVTGAVWHETNAPWVKLEGACRVGERAALMCGAADPRFIARVDEILPAVAAVVRDLVCEDAPEDYTVFWRVYGRDGVREAVPDAMPDGAAPPREVFLLIECIAPTRDRAAEVVRTFKQYLLHHGYPGRLSTGGNIAFPFTPPEVSLGTAYRFNVYHLMRAHDLQSLFPLELETL